MVIGPKKSFRPRAFRGRRLFGNDGIDSSSQFLCSAGVDQIACRDRIGKSRKLVNQLFQHSLQRSPPTALLSPKFVRIRHANAIEKRFGDALIRPQAEIGLGSRRDGPTIP